MALVLHHNFVTYSKWRPKMVHNVIVLNNINGDCLIATSKSISLECMVSDCIYVFKKVSKMATRSFIDHYISAF